MTEPIDYYETEYEEEPRAIEEVEDSSLVTAEEIEELFQNNRIVGFYENEESIEELPSFSESSIEEIEYILKDVLRYFSPEELDFIFLNLILGKSQTELTEIFEKTQPALCCDSSRIKEEIGVIRKMRAAREEVLEFLSTDGTGLSYMERNVLLVFFFSLSITKSAYILRINAMLCRSRIEATVKKLSALGYDKMFGYFNYVLEHLNKLKSNVSDKLKSETAGKWDYSSGYVSQQLF